MVAENQDHAMACPGRLATAPHLESARATKMGLDMAALAGEAVNTHQAVLISPGQWCIQMFVDGTPGGLVRTDLLSEREALYKAYVLARAEVPGPLVHD